LSQQQIKLSDRVNFSRERHNQFLLYSSSFVVFILPQIAFCTEPLCYCTTSLRIAMSTYQHDPRMAGLVGMRASTAQSRWSRHCPDPKSDPKQREGLGRCLDARRPRLPSYDYPMMQHLHHGNAGERRGSFPHPKPTVFKLVWIIVSDVAFPFRRKRSTYIYIHVRMKTETRKDDNKAFLAGHKT